MKKKLLALTLLAGSTGAFAQAAAFEGFTAGVNVSSVGGTTTLTGGDKNFSQTYEFGQQSFVPGVELGYNYAATQNIVLGLTATYDLTNSNIGNVNSSFAGDGISFKGQDRYSINFKPGYVITPSTMIYATVGYNAMSVKTSGYADGGTSTTSVSGIGYGIGLAVMATKNIFVKAEVQQVNFGSKSIFTEGDYTTSIKPNLTVGTIGIGYRF
jgi:outer membrane immunogenic protein